MSDLTAARADVVAACRRMVADGLVVGTSGNISVRVGDRIVITPTGVPYPELVPERLPVVDPDGNQLESELAPTSELPLHLAAYRAHPEATAVVHTHAVSATAVSTLVDTVPNIHYGIAAAGGAIRVAPYATYGTVELAENATQALKGRRACLLANHGTITVGPSLASAYDLTRQLEWACQVWLTAKAAGTPKLLPDNEMDRVAAKLRGYGQPGGNR